VCFSRCRRHGDRSGQTLLSRQSGDAEMDGNAVHEAPNVPETVQLITQEAAQQLPPSAPSLEVDDNGNSADVVDTEAGRQ